MSNRVPAIHNSHDIDTVLESLNLKTIPPMTKKHLATQEFLPVEVIERRILLIRRHKVMLDADLAALYQVTTSALNQTVRRNLNRFPEDFMFQLTKPEFENWRSQSVIANPAAKMSLRRRPYAFTEQGVAMLSGILRSERAAMVNIAIMRTFVRLRQILATHKELAERLAAMEKTYDRRFKVVFDILKQLMEPPPDAPKPPIGFLPPSSRKK